MIALMPHLVQVKEGQATTEQFTSIVDSLIHNRMVRKADRVFPSVPCEVVQEVIEETPALTLIDAWKLYRAEKGAKWTVAIASANERYIEPLIAILGPQFDVQKITNKDLRY